jgi:hypothetical protein
MTTSLGVCGHVACSHSTPRLRIKSITNIIAGDNEIILLSRMLAPSCCHQILPRGPSNRLIAVAVASPSPADIRHVNQVVVLGPMLPTRDRFRFLEKSRNGRVDIAFPAKERPRGDVGAAQVGREASRDRPRGRHRRLRWRQPKLAAWEVPRRDPAERRPSHPEVRKQRRVARQRWRAREHRTVQCVPRRS